MAALLTLEAIGPRGEELSLAAGDATHVSVGFDPEFECATFDADSLDIEELKEVVFEALTDLDPDWGTHLRVLDD
jgi:hypothetical protein